MLRQTARPADAKPPEPRMILIVERVRGVVQIVATCAAAARAGVRPGMTRGHALALLATPHIHEAEHDPAQDSAALRGLAQFCRRFSPRVAPDPPDGLLLDLTGCERLYASRAAHVAALAQALAQFGLQFRCAAAPTLGGAWALARYQSEPTIIETMEELERRLAPLPIAALRIEDATIAALREVGVGCVADLQRLSRDELAQRHGPALPRRLDQALGRATETLEAIAPPPPRRFTHVFPGPVDRIAFVEFAARELLQELLQALTPAGCGVQHFELTGVGPAGVQFELALHLTYPTQDAAHLVRMLTARLERVRLHAPVETLLLDVRRTGPLSAAQAAFWNDAGEFDLANAAAAALLVDQLQERLGRAAVQQCALAPSYIPERAFQWETVQTLRTQRRREEDDLPLPARRLPTRLYSQPAAVRVLALVPDGPPGCIFWGSQELRLRAVQGPERLSFPWWTGRRAALAARDYYRVQTASGRWLWLFRAHECGRWFVQGEWA